MDARANEDKPKKILPENWRELEYLTMTEVALLLRTSEKSLSRWKKRDGSMPVLQIAGAVRFPTERLLRWLRAREQGLGRPRQPQQLMHLRVESVEKPNGSTRQEPAMCPPVGHVS